MDPINLKHQIIGNAQPWLGFRQFIHYARWNIRIDLGGLGFAGHLLTPD